MSEKDLVLEIADEFHAHAVDVEDVAIFAWMDGDEEPSVASTHLFDWQKYCILEILAEELGVEIKEADE